MDNKKNGCWKNSKAEKCLVIFVIMFFLISVAFFVSFISRAKPKEDNLCFSKECIEQANELLKNMDPKADPCVDFYQYACGNYVNRTDLPEADFNNYRALYRENKFLMQKLIEKSGNVDEPEYYKKMKNFYLSCMDVIKIESLGASPLHAKLDEVGGWPLLGSSWNEDNFDMIETLVKFRRWGMGVQLFFTLIVIPHPLNATQNVIFIDQPKLLMLANYYKQEKYRELYLKHMKAAVTILGAEKSSIDSQLLEVLNFETDLAALSVYEHEQRDLTNFLNEMRLDDLQQILPQFDLVNFLNRLEFPKKITIDEKVVVTVPEKLKGVFSLISKTSKRIVANFMLWRFVYSTWNYLDERFQKLSALFNREIKGSSIDITRRKDYCISLTLSSISHGSAAIFVKHIFDRSSKQIVNLMVQDIKAELKSGINDADWLDLKTKKKAKEKLEALKALVAYPDQLLDDVTMNNLYTTLVISDNDFYNNQLRVLKWAFDINVDSLTKPIDELSWLPFARSLQANAMYYPLYNRIEIYAGVLGGNIFNPNWPICLNYASIGKTIGHEFVHGFDDRGRQFDKNGKFQNWWTDETLNRFQGKANMVIEQYSKFVAPEINMHVNGIAVQGEAISDIEGIKLAYKAYIKRENENKENPVLPGLQFNSKQLFWLKAANMQCENLSKEAAIYQIQRDFHPPSRFRVLGAFMNSGYFGKDYNCPVGSPMNPQQKISFYA